MQKWLSLYSPAPGSCLNFPAQAGRTIREKQPHTRRDREREIEAWKSFFAGVAAWVGHECCRLNSRYYLQCQLIPLWLIFGIRLDWSRALSCCLWVIGSRNSTSKEKIVYLTKCSTYTTEFPNLSILQGDRKRSSFMADHHSFIHSFAILVAGGVLPESGSGLPFFCCKKMWLFRRTVHSTTPFETRSSRVFSTISYSVSRDSRAIHTIRACNTLI